MAVDKFGRQIKVLANLSGFVDFDNRRVRQAGDRCDLAVEKLDALFGVVDLAAEDFNGDITAVFNGAKDNTVRSLAQEERVQKAGSLPQTLVF